MEIYECHVDHIYFYFSSSLWASFTEPYIYIYIYARLEEYLLLKQIEEKSNEALVTPSS